MTTLYLIHTSPVLTPLFAGLCATHMPEVKLIHMVDESLIKNTIAAGHLEKATMRRTIALANSAFEGGADAVMYTCSSIGPGVEIATALFDKPVLRVDEAMADEAARIAGPTGKIGVVATLGTTRTPFAEHQRRMAATCAVLSGRTTTRGIWR